MMNISQPGAGIAKPATQIGASLPAIGVDNKVKSAAAPTTGVYKPLGTYNDDVLKIYHPEEYAKIQALGTQWHAASGNPALQAQLHDQGEAIRALYNYSGGSDGSQYLPWGTPQDNTVANALQSGLKPYEYKPYDAPKPTFNDQYEGLLSTYIDRLANPANDYSYQYWNDPNWVAANRQYDRQAQEAGQSALAAASGANGGYNSSNAQALAAGVQQGLAGQALTRIPEFNQQDRENFLVNIDKLYKAGNLTSEQASRALQLYGTDLEQWNNEANRFEAGKLNEVNVGNQNTQAIADGLDRDRGYNFDTRQQDWTEVYQQKSLDQNDKHFYDDLAQNDSQFGVTSKLNQDKFDYTKYLDRLYPQTTSSGGNNTVSDMPSEIALDDLYNRIKAMGGASAIAVNYKALDVPYSQISAVRAWFESYDKLQSAQAPALNNPTYDR